jgi:WD40 repeat protein
MWVYLGGICTAYCTELRLLITGDKDGKVCAWSLDRGELVYTLIGHKYNVISAAVHGHMFVGRELDVSVSMSVVFRLVTSSHDDTMRIYDLRTFECVRVIATRGTVNRVAFDGVRIVTSVMFENMWHSSFAVFVWSVNTGE